MVEREHPVRLSAKRERSLNEYAMRLSVPHTLADRISALRQRSAY